MKLLLPPVISRRARGGWALMIVLVLGAGTGTTVGKANIGGAYGPRFGVAMGLLLASQRSGLEVDPSGG